MKPISEMVFLDEEFNIKATQAEYVPIQYFFDRVFSTEPLTHFATLWHGEGIHFEGVGCEIYDPEEDTDEEPFEVRFRVPHRGKEEDEVTYVTTPQFRALLILFAQSYFLKFPEQQNQLR